MTVCACTAFFARAFTQSFEDVPEEVIEALEATGASKLHIFLVCDTACGSFADHGLDWSAF